MYKFRRINDFATTRLDGMSPTNIYLYTYHRAFYSQTVKKFVIYTTYTPSTYMVYIYIVHTTITRMCNSKQKFIYYFYQQKPIRNSLAGCWKIFYVFMYIWKRVDVDMRRVNARIYIKTK